MQAVRRGHADVVTLLLDLGADARTWAVENTAIMEAAKQESAEVVAALLEHGADPNEPARWDGFGGPPLVIAAQAGHQEVIEVKLCKRSSPAASTLAAVKL